MKPPVLLNLEQAAREFGCSKETLRRALKEQGEPTGRGTSYTLRTIHDALSPPLKAERLKLLQAEASLKTLELRERQGVLLEAQEVHRLISEILLPVRQRFMALPHEAATRCNPTDPQFARDALQQWVDEALPLIREQLPKK